MTVSPDTFIARWQDREGGQERANYALFLSNYAMSSACLGPIRHQRAPRKTTTSSNAQ